MIAKLSHKPKNRKMKPEKKIGARRIIRFVYMCYFETEVEEEYKGKCTKTAPNEEKFHMSCTAYLSHIVRCVCRKVKDKHTYTV